MILLQEDLNRLVLWGRELNIEKYQVITFIRFSNLFEFDYKIHGLSVTLDCISVFNHDFHLSKT